VNPKNKAQKPGAGTSVPGKPEFRYTRLKFLLQPPALSQTLAALSLTLMLCWGFCSWSQVADKPRVLIIGLDGADWDLLDPMLTEGFLPHLSSLLEQGARGRLNSTIPANSPPAWRTAVTGVGPGKHGLFDFPQWMEDRYGMNLPRCFNKRAKPCWIYLTEHEKTSLLINIPTAYPPEPIQGHLFSGLLTPETAPSLTYPPELQDQYPGYEIDVTSDFNLDNLEGHLNDLRRIAKRRLEVALQEMDGVDWDLAWIVFTGCDRVQHRYLGFMNPGHSLYRHPERPKYQTAVRDFWILLDEAIGKIVAKAPPGTTVMLMSDHGHTHAGPLLLMYGWLHSLGLWHAEMKELELPWYQRIFVSKETLAETRALTIDWERTKAYASGYRGIFVNLKGREPNGIVSPGEEYEAVRDQIIQAASLLRDPRTGEAAFKSVKRREEVYEGVFLPDAPDLLFERNDGYVVLDRILTRKNAAGETEIVTQIIGGESFLLPGQHDQEGIVAVIGPDVPAGKRLELASLPDLLPTVYYCLGLPLPRYLEGNILPVFSPERLEQRPPVYVEDALYIDLPERTELSEADKNALQDQLRALGYIQ